jgi:leucyl aminopeptidase
MFYLIWLSIAKKILSFANKKSMVCQIKALKKIKEGKSQIVVLFVPEKEEIKFPKDFQFTADEKSYITKQHSKKNYIFLLPDLKKTIYIHIIIKKKDKKSWQVFEDFRIAGSKMQNEIKKNKINHFIIGINDDPKFLLYYSEGMLLADYRFQKYKTEKEEAEIKEIELVGDTLSETEIFRLKTLIEATYMARDLVNEPGSFLTATKLSEIISTSGKQAGYYTEVFGKAKIESLKMGGLLAVNRGSQEPPTFTILEWKPDHTINKKPLILIGKGLVFDTGGLSLKPTQNSMDEMKSDMAGAAAVISVIWAVSTCKLPFHVIGLIPATDNRPGENAYFPGDVITMFDGSTVEVLNTDAEGRMILADALAYAKKYKPQLVIDIATLTGSAAMAIGKYGVPAFTNMDDLEMQLVESGMNTYERLVSFPMWEEYGELIKSDIADLKNIGGKEAGAITAAKFLEKFTSYDWIHLDIAGSAFSTNDYNYQTKGGTGSAVRLLFEFITKKST